MGGGTGMDRDSGVVGGWLGRVFFTFAFVT